MVPVNGSKINYTGLKWGIFCKCRIKAMASLVLRICCKGFCENLEAIKSTQVFVKAHLKD